VRKTPGESFAHLRYGKLTGGAEPICVKERFPPWPIEVSRRERGWHVQRLGDGRGCSSVLRITTPFEDSGRATPIKKLIGPILSPLGVAQDSLDEAFRCIGFSHNCSLKAEFGKS
jgi:hypothetical protein